MTPLLRRAAARCTCRRRDIVSAANGGLWAERQRDAGGETNPCSPKTGECVRGVTNHCRDPGGLSRRGSHHRGRLAIGAHAFRPRRRRLRGWHSERCLWPSSPGASRASRGLGRRRHAAAVRRPRDRARQGCGERQAVRQAVRQARTGRGVDSSVCPSTTPPAASGDSGCFVVMIWCRAGVCAPGPGRSREPGIGRHASCFARTAHVAVPVLCDNHHVPRPVARAARCRP